MTHYASGDASGFNRNRQLNWLKCELIAIKTVNDFLSQTCTGGALQPQELTHTITSNGSYILTHTNAGLCLQLVRGLIKIFETYSRRPAFIIQYSL